MKKLNRPSWKAVRRGAIYCAPACGGKCTWAAYQKATRDARKLARRMGQGWTTRVWENLGWHYEVISPCGRIKVDKTPERAVYLVVKTAKKHLKQLGAELKGL